MEFRIVPLRKGKWVVQRRYRFLFGWIKCWSIAFHPDVTFSNMQSATKYIREHYPNEKLKITKGFKTEYYPKRQTKNNENHGKD